MPALAVGLISGSILTRFIRSATLESNDQDFARTARAKGLQESIVMRDHVLRNAMVPIITVAGIQLASLLGGVIVVEVLFAWPGLGTGASFAGATFLAAICLAARALAAIGSAAMSLLLFGASTLCERPVIRRFLKPRQRKD